MTDGPPPRVLEAFGVTGRPQLLRGGQGVSLRVEDLVLKPADDPEETAWVSELLLGLAAEGLRVAEPVRAGDGAWVVEGWSATRWLRGEPAARGRETDVLDVCDRVHLALRSAPRPSFIDRRDHWWARADRMVWGEQSMPGWVGIDPHVRRLMPLLEPVRQPAQLIHGDLGGNVLFDPALPPAVIDWSLYWRPAAHARAVVVVDSLLWDGAEDALARAEAVRDEGAQHLVRALLFRRVVFLLAEADRGPDGPWSDRDGDVVDLVADLGAR